MMKEEVRIARAKSDLEQHRVQMVKMWGEEYADHPQYHAAVLEIANKARMPSYVLADYRDRHKHKAPSW